MRVYQWLRAVSHPWRDVDWNAAAAASEFLQFLFDKFVVFRIRIDAAARGYALITGRIAFKLRINIRALASCSLGILDIIHGEI